jgi:ABC-type transport system involved in multi-copper enzyme maturation permease subunit
MNHLANLLRAEWQLLRHIQLATLAGLLLIGLPTALVLTGALLGRETPPPPMSVVSPVLAAALAPLGGLLAALVLVFSLGYEFGWGTVRMALARGASRPAWLAAKVLVVVLAEAVALLLSTALCLLALRVAYGAQGQSLPALPWATLFWVEVGGVLAAWVAAGAVALGTVLARSPLGGLLLGMFAYVADLALSFQAADLYTADLGAAGAPFARYLVTWNALSLAVHKFQPLPEPGWRAARLVLYAAALLALAGWVFWRQDLTRRT